MHGVGSGGSSPSLFLRRGWGLITTSPLHPPILGARLHVHHHSQEEAWGPRLSLSPERKHLLSCPTQATELRAGLGHGTTLVC